MGRAFRGDYENNVYRTRSVRRLTPADNYDLALLESIESSPWAARGIGEAPTDDFTLPFPMPTLTTTPTTTRVKEEESDPTRQSNTDDQADRQDVQTKVNVETGGTDQQGGASGS